MMDLQRNFARARTNDCVWLGIKRRKVQKRLGGKRLDQDFLSFQNRKLPRIDKIFKNIARFISNARNSFRMQEELISRIYRINIFAPLARFRKDKL